MTLTSTVDAFGVMIEPSVLKIERVLPGPAERVWAYLTEGELRQKWLAAGDMKLVPGATFELVWRNDELSRIPSNRPDGFGPEERMNSQILEVDPGRRLVFSWSDGSEVSFELTPEGEEVRLTIVHRRLPNRSTILGVSAGWHAHLDILVAQMESREAAPFWDAWVQLRTEYEATFPG
ncbi:SRPBCC family protein [Terrihabitans rhizophilus]|uniref:SRPBCC family protein n=1 Tax=Terrihabitans rhizophilus TaxID=3092662 RepID=A0ABU4RTI7_9HYPH|nr:SRPBCC family protein [Terrihabitans sp. PJ23]MDX6807468.1 SRPBCC family protein [Terrihabitans sp. PJ23]